jgi:hypothetical protein
LCLLMLLCQFVFFGRHHALRAASAIAEEELIGVLAWPARSYQAVWFVIMQPPCL